MVGKVIYINPNVLMCCYTEENQAVQLNDLLNKNLTVGRKTNSCFIKD